jgi:hypothetical protein
MKRQGGSTKAQIKQNVKTIWPYPRYAKLLLGYENGAAHAYLKELLAKLMVHCNYTIFLA